MGSFQHILLSAASWLSIIVLVSSQKLQSSATLSETIHGLKTKPRAPWEHPRSLTEGYVEKLNCTSELRTFDSLLHKTKYRVAVQTIHGADEAIDEYQKIFSEYLTETAGHRFNIPIEFEMVAMGFNSLIDAADNEDIDFIFSGPGAYSCVGVKFGAEPLVTRTSRVTVRGFPYELDTAGGVIFTLAENRQINSILDLKDKSIGAGDISTITTSQLQFQEMEVAGMSYVMDPLQVSFAEDQDEIVHGVLDGEFDVGFVRTDQLEHHRTEDGEPIDQDIFKVLEQKTYVMDDGRLFPFLHSTDIYPEWPVAALSHVSREISEEVQAALLAFRAHAEAGKALEECGGSCGPADAFTRCDTTKSLAQLAWNASQKGHVAGFRSARSYFDVRTMQHENGFLEKNELGEWECTRLDNLYGSIHCPAHHHDLTKQEFEESCKFLGRECKEGRVCYCRPCIKAFEVVVHQDTEDYLARVKAAGLTRGHLLGCDKMSVCGAAKQTETAKFHIHDNLKREDPIVAVVLHFGQDTKNLSITPHEELPFVYLFEFSQNRIGVAVLEVFVGLEGEQIPESPIRVQIVERMCDVDFPGQGMTADAAGSCVCGGNTIDINGKCVPSTTVAVTGAVAGLLLLGLLLFFYLQYKNRKADQVWMVSMDELHFDDPAEVIGEGSFGIVLLAEYRGTKVAIKRALRSDGKRGSRKFSSRGGHRRGSATGSRIVGSRGSADLVSRGSSNNTPSSANSIDIERGAPEDGMATSKHSKGDTPGSKDSILHSKSSMLSISEDPNNSFSLGFLGTSFGKNRWAWLMPWQKENDYQSRFKESILGSSSSVSRRPLTAMICSCFDAQARQREAFTAEMRVLARLRHPCITTLMGAVISNRHDPMIVMEYMEYGSLHDLLRNETMYLSGEIILQITRDIGQGLRFLHSSKPVILHGDLKAKNILIDARFRAKICDFGLSLKQSGGITGTPYWLAPEYLRGETSYNASCDIYSIGIILFEIYSRQNPYEGEDFRDVLRKVCNRTINKRPDIPNTCPSKMADLMKKCWNKDPFIRPLAKVLDANLLEMNMQDAEPLTEEQQSVQRKERATGDMLYQLFPKHIADALKAGQKVEPENHELVTVVFSDIVHFTDISREISPLKVSEMLDRLYLAFDKIASKHQVFKVETIGDAYMGVTNLENNQCDSHALHVAEFAIDMINEASKILIDLEDPAKGHINIRVGFHSGPVVSNVIGSLNPRYGLFGDTVNTASRMESNSHANRILCSERAHSLLKEQDPSMPTKKRGKISVKGRGDMCVYWVGDGLITANKTQIAADKKAVAFAADQSDSPPPEQAPAGFF